MRKHFQFIFVQIASLPKEKQENILQSSKNKKEIRIKVEEEIRLLQSPKIDITKGSVI